MKCRIIIFVSTILSSCHYKKLCGCHPRFPVFHVLHIFFFCNDFSVTVRNQLCTGINMKICIYFARVGGTKEVNYDRKKFVSVLSSSSNGQEVSVL